MKADSSLLLVNAITSTFSGKQNLDYAKCHIGGVFRGVGGAIGNVTVLKELHREIASKRKFADYEGGEENVVGVFVAAVGLDRYLHVWRVGLDSAPSPEKASRQQLGRIFVKTQGTAVAIVDASDEEFADEEKDQSNEADGGSQNGEAPSDSDGDEEEFWDTVDRLPGSEVDTDNEIDEVDSDEEDVDSEEVDEESLSDAEELDENSRDEEILERLMHAPSRKRRKQ